MEFHLLPIFVFLVFVLIWEKLQNKWLNNFNLPPGPWKIPLIGNMHQLVGSSPHCCLRNLANSYGPLMHLQLGEVSYIVISSAGVAKEVLQTYEVAFFQRPSILATRLISSEAKSLVFAAYGDYWRQLRKVFVTELLSARQVQSLRSIREEEASQFVRSISTSGTSVINLSKLIFSLTYNITSKAAFGKICKDQEAFLLVAEEIIKVASGLSVSDMFPSFKLLHIMSGMKAQVKRLHKDASRILENIINEHRTRESRVNSDSKEKIYDLVDVLLSLQEQKGLEFDLTDEHIKALILDIFLAGSETSSTALEWAVSELLKNPRSMKKAQTETRQVFGRQGAVDETRLQDLHYLKLVIKETLRLHPPAPLLIPRECTKTCKIVGYEIPVKSRVIINAWAIGRDPTYWNEPEKFCPERFVDTSIDYKGNSFEFIPFGAGRRICPGISFAHANIEFPLATLLYHFDWQLPNSMKPENIDMSEVFGVTVRRKRDLLLVPIPYNP